MQPTTPPTSSIHCPLPIEDPELYIQPFGIRSHLPDISNRPHMDERSPHHTDQLISSLVNSICEYHKECTYKVDRELDGAYTRTTHTKQKHPVRHYLAFGSTAYHARVHLKRLTINALHKVGITNIINRPALIHIPSINLSNKKRTPECKVLFEAYTAPCYIIKSYKDHICYYD